MGLAVQWRALRPAGGYIADLQSFYSDKLKLGMSLIAGREGGYGTPFEGSEPRRLLGAGDFSVSKCQSSSSPELYRIGEVKHLYLCEGLSVCARNSERRVQR